jgi:homeobox protein YOX1/YHP1
MRSSHPVSFPASSYPQYQLPASSAYPAGHSSSRGAVHTAAAAPTHYQQPMATSHAFYLDRTNPLIPSSRNTTQLPNVRVPTAPSPVHFDVPPVTSEPTIKKKRKRTDARQLAALNRMYTRDAYPSTEERQQLARDLDMSARSVQNWSVLPLFATCIISELWTILSGSGTKGRRAVKLPPALQSARSL